MFLILHHSSILPFGFFSQTRIYQILCSLQGVYISSSLDATSASIFNNNPVGVTSDPWCFASLPKKCQSFSSHQSVSEECLISLITIEGSLLFVTLPAFNNQSEFLDFLFSLFSDI